MTYDVNFANERFVHIFYMAAGGTEGGKSADNPADLANADAMRIPAGCLVDKCYVLVDEAVVGATAVDVGDDDDADGYVPAAGITLGTPGLYGHADAEKGAYLTAGAAKLYDSATSGKEVKVAVTGTATAGALRVVVEGTYLGR